MRLRNNRYEEIKRLVVCLYKECGIHTYPISYQEICKKMGIILIPYSELSERKQNAAKELSSDGFHLLIQDLHSGELVRLIYYNDSNTRERIRWTILHEIGHIVLDHSEESELAESEANFFAKYALAPPPLVHAAGCKDFIDIMVKFDLSVTASLYTMSYYRKWLTHYGPSMYQEHEIAMLRLFGVAG